MKYQTSKTGDPREQGQGHLVHLFQKDSFNISKKNKHVVYYPFGNYFHVLKFKSKNTFNNKVPHIITNNKYYQFIL